MRDVKSEAYLLLQKMLEVFENECCISCSRCHELRDEIATLLKRIDEPSACVQPNQDCRTQTALCPADGTQRRGVWHDCEDIPDDFNHDVIAVTINGTWFKMPVSDLRAFLSGLQRLMIRRWAYIKDLEAL